MRPFLVAINACLHGEYIQWGKEYRLYSLEQGSPLRDDYYTAILFELKTGEKCFMIVNPLASTMTEIVALVAPFFGQYTHPDVF